jgi:mono/diheme cytochrome c family protein
MRIILVAALVYASVATATSLEGTPSRRSGGEPAQASSAAAQPQSDAYRDVYNGWKWWHVYCYRCHGVDAIGTANAPNLTDPNRKLGAAEFHKIVKNGIPDKGMQAWDKLLDDRQIDQLFIYVRARTEKVLPPGRPDENGPNGGPWVPPNGWPGKPGARSSRS